MSLLAVLFALTFLPHPAKASIHGYTPCAYSGYSDGCAGAGSGNIQHSTFFTGYANQSGQTYLTRPPWNVAGVDYSIGIPTGTVLLDPATASLPSGCTYSATGSSSGGPIVKCQSTANPTLNSLDFSGTVGGQGCIQLEIKTSVTGTVTIENSNFLNGANCTSNNYLISIDNQGTASVVLLHDVIDGDAPAFPTVLLAMIYASTTGTLTIEYSAILRAPCRPIIYGTGAAGALVMEFNYIEGWIYEPNQGHGEIVVPGFITGPIPTWQFSYNTILQPAAISAGSTTAIYFALANTSQVITAAQADHNVIVMNYASGNVGGTITGTITGATTLTVNTNPGSIPLGRGQSVSFTGVAGTFGTILDSGSGNTWTLNNAQTNQGPITITISGVMSDSTSEVAHSAFTQVTYDHNYTDATGSLVGAYRTASSPQCTNPTIFTGNVNLKTGNPVTGFTGGDCPPPPP